MSKDLPEDWARLREIWRSMRKRCYNPKCKDYKEYGARHIGMCPEWRDDFEAFYNWAITHGYRSDLTIDRVMNNKGYSPGNCRWISRKAQAQNRRTNTHLTIDGHTKTISRWSEETGIEDYTIIKRMKAGWTAKEAVFTPKGMKPKRE